MCEENKIGLVLSGGGMKGAAHLGALKALEENNIKISAITGTSIGGILGSLYAVGYKSMEILDIFKKYAKEVLRADPRYIIDNVKNKKHLFSLGLLSGQKIADLVNEYANKKGVKKITDIKMPISMPAVDISLNKEYMFTNRVLKNQAFFEDNIIYVNNVDIGTAARATSSYPGVFTPCEFQNVKLVDGGVVDNVPVNEMKNMQVDKILTIKFPPQKLENLKHVYEVVFKSVEIMSESQNLNQKCRSDFEIDVYLKSSCLFNVKKIDYCFEQGYISTIAKMDMIKEKLLVK